MMAQMAASEAALQKTTVIGVLAALINYSEPQMFGAAVTGSLIYYVMFADRGKWENIVLFLVSIPLALHVSPVVADHFSLMNRSGLTLTCGALGLMVIEKCASWIRNPAGFIKTLREVRQLNRPTIPGPLNPPAKGDTNVDQ